MLSLQATYSRSGKGRHFWDKTLVSPGYLVNEGFLQLEGVM
jgi:hypothetical protein